MPTLQYLKSISYQAGEIVKEGFGNHKNPRKKSTIDIVTEVDQEVEAFLVAQIIDKFPNHSIVAEESGEVVGDENHKWFIDPIDGTTNFANGLPIFCISIAYMEIGKLKFGVIYDPNRNEIFSAERGKGAWLNDFPLRVGHKRELKESILVTGFPYDRFTNPNNNLKNFSEFALQVRGIRRLGAAALDLCYVAAGRVDGYWELYLEPWDLAAGLLIATEAGAKITRVDGSKNEMLNPPCSVVASNELLHEEMLKILNNVNP